MAPPCPPQGQALDRHLDIGVVKTMNGALPPNPSESFFTVPRALLYQRPISIVSVLQKAEFRGRCEGPA
jgi:hypothetical protein